MKKLYFILSVLSSFTLAQDVFTYRVYYTNVNEIGACTAEITAIAKRLSEQAQVETFNPRCEWNEILQSITMLVDYRANKALNFVTTEPPLSAGHFGMYTKLEDCQKDMAQQEELFQRETGLPILYSTCTSRYSGAALLKIDGVGTPVRAPYYTKVYTDGRIHSPKVENVLAHLKEFYASKNANLVKVRLGTSMPENNIMMFYYGTQAIELTNEHMYAIPGLEVCENERLDLEQAFAQNGMMLPLSYCGSPFQPGLSSDLYIFPEKNTYKVKKSLEGFKDYKTCNAVKTDLTVKYESALSKKIMAGICQRDLTAKEYRVSFFIKN